MHKKLPVLTALALMSTFGFGSSALALPILTGTDSGGDVWTGSDAEGRLATAQFADISSGSTNAFSVTLSNLAAAADSRQPNEILVGIMFDFSVDPGIIDPSSDVFSVNVTGSILGATATYGTNLDGEFAFMDGMLGPTGGLGEYVISSSAYDPLGINPVIDPTVAYHPLSTNGAGFGIAAVGASPTNGVKGWVDGSATIRFETTGGIDLGQLTSVQFMYGTSFYPSTSVPEPYTLSMLGAGLIVVGFSSRRRRKLAS